MDIYELGVLPGAQPTVYNVQTLQENAVVWLKQKVKGKGKGSSILDTSVGS